MENGRISPDILDDLCCRFVVNMPKEQLNDPIRVCFQIELAYWFFVDHYEEVQAKKCCSLRDFIRVIFTYLPCLKDYATTVDEIIANWRSYKTKVPTYGAILLDTELENMILVQGEFAKSSWGFPKGKVNEAEPPQKCAIREVREETGYDISKSVEENLYFERKINDTLVRLYLVTGVDKNFQFQPETKNEIRNIKWFRVNDLPVNKNDNTKNSFGIYANHFYGVVPFVESILQWIDGVKNGKRRKSPPYLLKNGFGCESPSSPLQNGHSPASFNHHNSKSTASFEQQQQRHLAAKHQQRFNARQRAKSFTASNSVSVSAASTSTPSSLANCQQHQQQNGYHSNHRNNGYYTHHNHYDTSTTPYSASSNSNSIQNYRFSPSSKNIRTPNSTGNKNKTKTGPPKQRLFSATEGENQHSSASTSSQTRQDKVLNGKLKHPPPKQQINGVFGGSSAKTLDDKLTPEKSSDDKLTAPLSKLQLAKTWLDVRIDWSSVA